MSDKLTERLKSYVDNMMEKHRKEWNKIDLPILCSGCGIFIGFLMYIGTKEVYLPFIVGIVSFIGLYIFGYDRRN